MKSFDGKEDLEEKAMTVMEPWNENKDYIKLVNHHQKILVRDERVFEELPCIASLREQCG